MDFDSGNALDHEGILLGLRAVLGTFRTTWPAFALALAVYWERAHPGLPMQEALNNSSALRRVNRDIHLGTQLQNAIQGMLQNYGGAVGVFAAGARVAGRSIRGRVRRHQPDSSLAQFVRRSLVQKFPNDFLPYGIHEMLRDAVREADIAEDRWSEREWAAAAGKLSAEIHRRVEPELEASGSVDRGLESLAARGRTWARPWPPCPG